MSFLGGLVCPDCGSELEVSISYDGCDWNSVAGEGSGFDYSVNLDCIGCARTYEIGHIKRTEEFSKHKESKTISKRLSRMVEE